MTYDDLAPEQVLPTMRPSVIAAALRSGTAIIPTSVVSEKGERFTVLVVDGLAAWP